MKKRGNGNNTLVVESNSHGDQLNEASTLKVKPRLYSKEYTFSKAYLDLPTTKMSLHKFIHTNRILIFTLVLLYIIVDNRNHGFVKFYNHLSTLSKIFVNPFQLVIDLGMMSGLSFLVPIGCYLHYNKKIGKNLVIGIYLLSQTFVLWYTILFVFNNDGFPIGTKLFMAMQLVVVFWKSHSYFVVFNYHSLVKKVVKKGDGTSKDEVVYKDFSIKSEPLFNYLVDYMIFLPSPTLIYDQYSELREADRDNKDKNYLGRFVSILKELYTSLAIITIVHYVHVEYLFPELFVGPTVKSFIKILVPAEITFQLLYYLLYHCVFSLLADLTNFKDRLSFYDNYWESSTCKSMLQGWSKPVHSWLYRHTLVDLKLIFGVKNKFLIFFFTMLFSGMFHEVIVKVTSNNICVPWTTLNLVCCGIVIIAESAFKLGDYKVYNSVMRVFLFIGHGAFYFAYFHLCFCDHRYDLIKL